MLPYSKILRTYYSNTLQEWYFFSLQKTSRGDVLFLWTYSYTLFLILACCTSHQPQSQSLVFFSRLLEAEFSSRRDNGQIVLKMMLDQVTNAVKGTILCTNLKIKKDMQSYHLPEKAVLMLNLRPKPDVTIQLYEFDRYGSLEKL